MKKKILTVDDDPDFREAVVLLLESKGYEVLSAGNGQTGFAKAHDEKPDLILLDVMMTYRTEGFDIVHKLHNDPATKDIPVITVTGIGSEKEGGFHYQPDEVWLPVRAVLEKPVRPELLLKTIEAHIKK